MILVTGATGNVGAALVRQLVESNHAVRAFVRDGVATNTLAPGVEIARGDLARPESLEAALAGVDKMYLLCPAVPGLPELEAGAIAAAKRAGVRHVVKHSNMGADREPPITLPRWHRAGEQLIERSGMAWTFVRPTGFMSNALGWAGMIKHGTVYAPATDGKLSVVDPRDIAAVACAALTEPGHEGKAYDVTGPEALSTAEQVAMIGEAIGRPIKCIDVPNAAARDSMIGMGMPAIIVDALLEFMDLVRAGRGATVSDAVPRVTGKRARTFAAWVAEHAGAFP
jgi:uncharacterized protein YbjT (DUF2867 family)